MRRRDFNLAMGSVALGSLARRIYATDAPGSDRGPLFWMITRAKARVFLLGFGDAKDKAWFTPMIQRAFELSSQLWLEVGPAAAPQTEDAATRQANANLRTQLEHESGRTFFDTLQPAVRSRLPTYLETLGVKKESLETLRPWRAYYVINSAFWVRTQLPYQEVYVDEVLFNLATSQGKSFGYETPTKLDFARFMATMPDAAQSEYIGWLLDYIDDQRSGANDHPFEWYAGYPNVNTRNLDRMRVKYPELYQVMQMRRNAWWARKINELLSTSGTYFIAIGQLHVLGPDGIPRQLQRLKGRARFDLQENPPPELLG
jgi:uncharacterized protein YbaP (TraB family)